MTPAEEAVADIRLTGVASSRSPMALARPALAADGILTIAEVAGRAGQRVRVAGVVTHRQRPHTASGMVFLNLEDETGLLNVVCSAGMWRRYRGIGRRASALVARGTVEAGDGVVALIGERLEALGGIVAPSSRDWA